MPNVRSGFAAAASLAMSLAASACQSPVHPPAAWLPEGPDLPLYCYETLGRPACYRAPDVAATGARIPGWNGYVDTPAEDTALQLPVPSE